MKKKLHIEPTIILNESRLTLEWTNERGNKTEQATPKYTEVLIQNILRLVSFIYIAATYNTYINLFWAYHKNQSTNEIELKTINNPNSKMSEQQSEVIGGTAENNMPTIDAETKSQTKANRKLSLTLPLLNVIGTEALGNEHVMDVTVTQSDDQPSNCSEPPRSTPSKMKQIYESDDLFVQTIFSQTIKSTTATPTDDEFSPEYDTSHSCAAAMQSDATITTQMLASVATNTTIPNVSKYALSSIDEPIAAFTYFHQTIEADEPPHDFHESITSYSPSHGIAAHQLNAEMDVPHDVEHMDYFDGGDDNYDKNINNIDYSATFTSGRIHCHEHPDIPCNATTNSTNTLSVSDSADIDDGNDDDDDDEAESETSSLSSAPIDVSIFV